MQIPTLFSVLALGAIICLLSEHEIEANQGNLGAFKFNVTEQLRRLKEPFYDSEGAGQGQHGGGAETPTDVLLQPLRETVDPIDNVTDICDAIMHHMASAGANLTRCMISHARPFRMCEKCVSGYTRFVHVYEDLRNNEKCQAALLLADRMNIMSTLYKTFTSTWSNAYCDSCFESVEENSTTGVVHFNFTAETLLFRQMQVNVSKCFLNYTEGVDDESTNSSEACHACKDVYRKMNNEYRALKMKNEQICMDLFDMMNYTRLLWSTGFHCYRPPTSATVVIIISVVCGIKTILLYTCSKYLATIRLPQIFQPKRMKTKMPRYGALAHTEIEGSLPSMSASPVRQAE